MAQATLKATLEFDVKGEAELKKVKTQLKGIGDAGNKAAPGIEKSTKATSGLQSSIKGLIGAGLLIGAGKALLDFGRASIMAASDVEEMRSKFDTVFRDLGPQVTAELDKFAAAANRSTIDLQGFAATIQDTFVPLGFARDEAADMSVEIVKLAEDLASFNNLPTQQVVEDLQSALVGNTETLRKYGVVANQAAIDQEALALGLDFTKGKMDGQTKAAAILSLAMKSTADAQGDAIKTADSYANQSKGLEAAMLDLKVAIGDGLLPIVSALTGELTDMVQAVTGPISAWSQLRKAVDEGKLSYAEANKLFVEMAFTGKTSGDVITELAEAESVAAHNAGEFSQELAELNRQAAESQKLENVTRGLEDAGGAAHTYSLQLDELRREFRYSSDASDNYAMSLEELARMGRDALPEATENVAEALKEQEEAAAQARQALAGDFVTAINDATDGMGFFNESLEDVSSGATAVTTNQGAVNQAIFESAQASGASAEQLGILGGALGLYSDEAVNAALKSAAIQAKIDELTQSYLDGDISVQEMRTELRLFTDDLENIPESTATEVTVEGIDEARGKVDSLLDAFNRLPGAGGGVGGPAAGGGAPAEAFAQGGSFVVGGGGGIDSQLVAFRATPGEVVDVRRPDQVNNSNSLSLTQNFVGSPPSVRQEARDGVMEAARQIGLRGYA